jgi:hypothetical protein
MFVMRCGCGDVAVVLRAVVIVSRRQRVSTLYMLLSSLMGTELDLFKAWISSKQSSCSCPPAPCRPGNVWRESSTSLSKGANGLCSCANISSQQTRR